MSDAIIFGETLYLVGLMGLANISCVYKGMLHNALTCQVMHALFFFSHAPVPLGLMLVVSTLQFAPTYHDYVLYSSQEGDDGTTKYRSRTFVPTGHEMDAVRRNRHMFGNKIDDIQLSSVSSSGNSSPKTSTTTVQDSTDPEAMKSSLLMDTTSSPSKPYDLSLIDMDLSSYPAKVPAVDSNPDTR